MGCGSSKNLANPEPVPGEGKTHLDGHAPAERSLQRGDSSHPMPNLLAKVPESVAHGFVFDVFLTHDWGLDCNGISNHARVARLNRYLKMKGVKTWFDDEQMEGNVIDQMCDGIDRSALIVVCITKRYVEKVTGLHSKNDNCRAEFTYARSKKTAEGMIPVVMERRMMDSSKWDGPVGMTLDGADTDSVFIEQCEKIYRYIQTRISAVHGVAAQESGWTVDPVPQPLVGTKGASDAEEVPTNLVCATPAVPSNKEVSSSTIVTQAEGGKAQNHHEAGKARVVAEAGGEKSNSLARPRTAHKDGGRHHPAKLVRDPSLKQQRSERAMLKKQRSEGGMLKKKEPSPNTAKAEAEGKARVQAQQSDKECKEVLELKLADVTAPLELKQSIDLLCYCIRAGESRAAMLDGKETLILIGNTGAGKSTLGNYLAGCTMIKKEPGEDSEHEDDVIVVQGICDGGKMDEVTPIGHTSVSKTFMPEIFQCPDSFMFCDCPGFLDSRGAEINIGNAVNIKAALSRALNARVIVLINYFSLKAERGRGVAEMLAICSHLFGSEENVKRYKESIMLCVTNAPSGDTVEKIRRMLLKGAVTNSSIMKDLVERLFLYCPLDSGLKDRLSRDAILSTVRDIRPIPDPSSIFQTVLTGDDENRLVAISHEMGKAVAEALEGRDFFRASEMVSRLQNLVAIDHATVKRLLAEAWERVRHFFRSSGDKVKADCHFTRFDKARDALEVIEAASHHFEGDVTAIDELREWYESSSNMHRERLQRDQEQSEQLMAAHTQVQELGSLLQQQQEETKRQLKEQTEHFDALRESLEQRMQETVAEKEAAQNALQKELADIMTRKDAEIRAAAESEKERLEKERESLKKEFESRLEEASQMTEAAVAKQAEEKARMAAEHEENLKALQLKMSDIEGKQQQVQLELQRKEEEHQKREEEQARLRAEREAEIKLLEEGRQQQQEETKRQLKEQEERFEQLRESLEQWMQETVAEKEAAQNALQKELSDIMTRKDAEIRAAAESEKERLEKERESLKKEFESRLEEASQMTEAAVAKQAEEKARMAAEHEENLKALQVKLKEIDEKQKQSGESGKSSDSAEFFDFKWGSSPKGSGVKISDDGLIVSGSKVGWARGDKGVEPGQVVKWVITLSKADGGCVHWAGVVGEDFDEWSSNAATETKNAWFLQNNRAWGDGTQCGNTKSGVFSECDTVTFTLNRSHAKGTLSTTVKGEETRVLKKLPEKGLLYPAVCLVHECQSYFLLPNGKPAVGWNCKRGPNWKWGDQDGGKSNRGVTVECKTGETDGWVRVAWKGVEKENNNRFGKDDNYDIELLPSACSDPPIVGATVRRGPDWKWGKQDGGKGKLGKVTEAVSSSGWIEVKWETDGDSNKYRWGADECYDIEVVNLGGPAKGTRVRRGKDWRWGDQDGGDGKEGTVCRERDSDGWIGVKWDEGQPGKQYKYRWDKDGDFDIEEVKDLWQGEGAHCRKGHNMSMKTSCSWNCDGVCGRRGIEERTRQRCDDCDYDLCSDCHRLAVDWPSKSSTKVGDMLRVTQHRSKVDDLTNGKVDYLGCIGETEEVSADGAKLKMSDGVVIQWKWKSLEKVEALALAIRTGDRISIIADEEQAKKACASNAGWNSGMKMMLGKEGRVKDVKTDRVRIESQGSTYLWGYGCVEAKASSKTAASRLSESTVSKGAAVRIVEDVDQAKKGVNDAGDVSWDEGMINYVGSIGLVVEFDHTSVKLKHWDKRVLWWGYGSIERAEELRERVKDGEKLTIIPSMGKAKKLLMGNGGWNDSMSEHLGKVGEIETIREKGVRLKVDGDSWFWPFTCVIAKPAGHSLTEHNVKEKMVLRATSDVNVVQKGCKAGGFSFTDDMHKFLGTLGAVVEVDSVSAKLQHSDGGAYWWPFSGLERSSAIATRIKKGDKVKIITSAKQAKKRLKKCGGWVSDMRQHLGEIAEVDSSNSRGVQVTHKDEAGWFWCWACIEALVDAEEELTSNSKSEASDSDSDDDSGSENTSS